VNSKTLANQALEPVSIDRATNVFLRDGKSQTRMPKAVGARQDEKTLIGGTETIVKNPTIFVGFQQPSIPGKYIPRRVWQIRRSGRQP
jgi:hypothetical protein